MTDETVHAIRDDRSVTTCCGRTPFELPRANGHRLTTDERRATCRGRIADAAITANAKREMAALERIAADPGCLPLDRVMALLTAHQRFSAGGCLCGWSRIGRSHAGHQAEMLARAGLIVEAPGGRRNPRCSNCGDTRGGPVGHESYECTWEGVWRR